MMPRNFLRISLRIGSVLLALLAATPSLAADNEQIRHAVDRFMATHASKLKARFGAHTRIEYSIAALDTRQTFPECAAPLNVESRDQTPLNARLSLQVSCAKTEKWSIYVPVDLTIYRPVVVAVKPLTHGVTVGADDVQLNELNVTQIVGQYLSSLDDAIGKDVKRAIASGSPILEPQLEPPLVVRRGEAVVINATSSIVAVKVSGIALTDGRLGEQIRIKNLSSTRIVQAKIVGPGQAEVPM
jgi:flagella basal body P-ring formation protein FlgA